MSLFRVAVPPGAAVSRWWSLTLLAFFLQACSSLSPRPFLPIDSALSTAPYTTLGSLASLAPSPELSGFRLLPQGSFALDARMALGNAAERTLDLQSYIFRCDAIGVSVLAMLRSAAHRGVRVRLLVDDFHFDNDGDCFLEFSKHPNVQVRMFNPLPARSGTSMSRVFRSLGDLKRINHRMHNKLFIADNSVSVSGGRNIGREYFMQDDDANFIDMDVLAVGAVVREQSVSFDRYWNSEYAYPIGFLTSTATASTQQLKPLLDKASQTIRAEDAFGHSPVSRQIAEGRLELVWVPARVVADAPEKIAMPGAPERFAKSVAAHTLRMIESAKTRVIAISPYFIPSPLALDIMRENQQRGVWTTVLTNSFGATDEALVHYAYARHRKELLSRGVSVYELGPEIARKLKSVGSFGRSQGRLHAKILIVDDAQVFIGSMNMDERSASLNTEIGLVIDSATLAHDFRRLMDGDHFYGAYRLRTGENGQIQWIDRNEDGSETVLDVEPDLPIIPRLKRWLMTPLIPEELL
jgi:putative cardiolipin synthase